MNDTQKKHERSAALSVDEVPGNAGDRERGREAQPLGDQGHSHRTSTAPAGEQGISNRPDDADDATKAIAGDQGISDGNDDAPEATDATRAIGGDHGPDQAEETEETELRDIVADSDQDDDSLVADQLASEDPDPLTPRRDKNAPSH